MTNSASKRRSSTRVHRVLSSLIMALLCALFVVQCFAQVNQDKIVITPVEGWSAVFGDQKITWHFLVQGLDAVPARATWVLAADERALARGEVPVTKGGERGFEVTVPVSIPPVKPGIVFPLTLTVSLLRADNTVLATATKRLWVYPTNPIEGRVERLKKLNLRLYDPDGLTARRLDAANIPYTAVGNPDALAEGEPGVALIGEGLSFDDYRSLAGAIVKAAAAGRPVLCLAPTGGAFPIPGTEGADLEPPSQLRLRRADVITELDKRLDAFVWPKGPSVSSVLTLKASRDEVIGEVKRSTNGWSWLECTYVDGGSTLIVCGFGIMAHWDDGPTPRFLFVRLLSYLDDLRSAENTAELFKRSQK